MLCFLAITAGQGACDMERSKMRTWSNKGNDDGSVHAMGNGDMVIYGQGPNVPFAYGPPYSTPGIFSLVAESDSETSDEATRELGTAIWNHKTRLAGKDAVEFTEFVASRTPAYVRIVKCSREGVRWVIRPNPLGGFIPSESIPNAWVQTIRPGQNLLNYPTNLWAYHWVIATGCCRAELGASGELLIRCTPGEGSLAIVGGLDYPSGVANAENLAKQGAPAFLEPTRKHWQAFTKKRMANIHGLKPDARSAEILDSAAVLIKAQQSKEGGVMAGMWFPLAYIRDQYGVARGMLALGMYEEAKLNLEFRLAKFQRFGTLLTAEAMGTDSARHQHENDEVEGPAYTILQARDYIKATGDTDFGRELWPMLSWCWKVQQRNVADGITPFNGDETYVAGGFFPRSGLVQGSADTTLVYAESGKWLIHFALDERLWKQDHANKQLERVKIAREAYLKHFLDKDRIWANEPEREHMAEPPRFRHGVCEGLCGWFGWTERSKTGRYACPTCLATKDLPTLRPAKMEVNSVSLLPAYIGSDFLTKAEMRAVVEHVISQANPKGHIASVPGTEGCVGYDPGLILMNLLATGHPAAAAACERMTRILDRTDSWNEYYDATDSPRPGCCRCRPWESGVNAAALVDYLRKK